MDLTACIKEPLDGFAQVEVDAFLEEDGPQEIGDEEMLTKEGNSLLSFKSTFFGVGSTGCAISSTNVAEDASSSAETGAEIEVDSSVGEETGASST